MINEHLGMMLDYSVPGKAKIYVFDHVKNMLKELPPDMTSKAITVAANHLFEVNDNLVKLDTAKAELFHHVIAKLLFLCKQAQPANGRHISEHPHQVTRHQ